MRDIQADRAIVEAAKQAETWTEVCALADEIIDIAQHYLDIAERVEQAEAARVRAERALEAYIRENYCPFIAICDDCEYGMCTDERRERRVQEEITQALSEEVRG
jgi:hypothetical protein